MREAVKGADGWLKQGSAKEGENVEHRLMKAIAANDVSDKANADAVLETVRTRRAELAADSLFDSAKAKLDAKAIVEAVALLQRYVADGHATKKPEAQRLLADYDLATSDKAALQTLMALSDERFVQFRNTGKLDDRKITHPILVEIRATTLRRNLQTANQRREEIRIAEAKRQQDEKIAEAKRQESERLALEAARRDVATVWLHKPGNGEPGVMTLLPNGKINDPNGQASWTLTGRTLVLRWPEPRLTGGFWIDTCTLSDDGKTYLGANQKNMPIVGWKDAEAVQKWQNYFREREIRAVTAEADKRRLKEERDIAWKQRYNAWLLTAEGRAYQERTRADLMALEAHNQAVWRALQYDSPLEEAKRRAANATKWDTSAEDQKLKEQRRRDYAAGRRASPE